MSNISSVDIETHEIEIFIYQHNKTPARKRNITHKAKNKTREAKKYCLLNKCEFFYFVERSIC